MEHKSNCILEPEMSSGYDTVLDNSIITCMDDLIKTDIKVECDMDIFSQELEIKKELIQMKDTLIKDKLGVYKNPIDDSTESESERIGKKQYECNFCNRAFVQRGAFKIHLRKHTGERPYNCTHCDRAFMSKGTLACHLRTHTGDKPYDCRYCDRTFENKFSLAGHLRKHTGERTYKCNDCNKSYIGKDALTKHLMTHSEERMYESCHYCNKTWTHKDALAIHLGICSMKSSFHNRPYQYKCSHCDLTFRLKETLDAHLQIGHTVKRPDEKIPLHTWADTKAYYRKTPNNTRHVFSNGSDNDCNEDYTDKSALTKQLRTHPENKCYECHYCNMSFTNKGYLTLHLMTCSRKSLSHSRPYQYKCSHCDLTFRLKEILDTHLMVVHLKKKFD